MEFAGARNRPKRRFEMGYPPLDSVGRPLRGDRDGEMKSRAPAGFTLRPKRAIHQLGKPLADGQLDRASGLERGVRCNATAGITDGKFQALLAARRIDWLRGQRQTHFSGVGELDRAGQEAGNDLPQSLSIPRNPDRRSAGK